MSKYFKPKSILILFIVALTAIGCSDDNTSIEIPDDDTSNPTDPTDPPAFDADLYVDEAGGDMRVVEVVVEPNNSGTDTIKAKIKFATTSESMRRLYVTEEINGDGETVEEEFVFIEDELSIKKDGSLDLPASKSNGFEYQLSLPTPTAAEGNIVYKFWTTTGRGDFRDPSKRIAIEGGIGTITVKAGEDGTGTDTSSGIRVYENIILSAPLGDGSSETFMSVYNSVIYKISEGEEAAALWDIGYFFLSSGASIASTSAYPSIFNFNATTQTGENVSQLTNVPQSELNNFYMAISNIDYDSVAVASDLNAFETPTSQKIEGLSAGDIIEFEDNYQNKGLIKVESIVPGDGTSGQIVISIKVQS